MADGKPMIAVERREAGDDEVKLIKKGQLASRLQTFDKSSVGECG